MRSRVILQLFALVAIVLAGGSLFLRHYENSKILAPLDYLQYWSAGKALIDGQNPYDGNVLYPYQQAVGTPYDFPIMMWNPPWTLPITFGLGSLHWRTGQLIWLTLNIVSIVVASRWLWKMYGGPAEKLPMAILASLIFAPTAFILIEGQISGLLILGLAGHQYYLQRNRPRLAGLFLSLIAIKPHLFLPIACVYSVQSLANRNIRTSILIGILTLITMGLIPLLWNTDIWSMYFNASTAAKSGNNYTLHDWVHPTLGHILRESIPGKPFVAMFIPCLIIIPASLAYWYSRRERWEWNRELPLLTIASLIAAPYGAWGYDLILLLIPVQYLHKQLLESPRFRIAVIGYVAVNAFALLTLKWEGAMTNYWLTPLVGLAYVAWRLKPMDVAENPSGFSASPWVESPQKVPV